MIKAVIFDLDDTLISEKEYIKSGYRAVSRYLEQRYSIDATMIEKELLELLQKDEKNIFNRWMDMHHYGYTKQDIMSLVSLYRNHVPEIRFFEDVVPTLFDLKKRSIGIGIISDGYLNTQRNKLNVVEADKYFDKIILTEELGREYWKPHSLAFEMMQEFFHISFEEMMYVGDNPEKDFYIRQKYPISTVRIIRKSGVYADAKYRDNIKEMHRITSLDELQELL